MQRIFPIAVLITIALLGVASGQESATGMLDQDRVTAGQTFHVKVTLSEPPSYVGQLNIWYDYKRVDGVPPPQSTVQISCSGNTAIGSVTADLQCGVPTDADSGIYVLEAGIMRFAPPPGGSKQRAIPLKVADVQIVSIPDTNIYPSSAAATISLSQKQILLNSSAKVTFILDQLSTRTDQHAAETKDLRQYLVSVANIARDQLRKTRNQYRESLNKGQAEPIFFEDFDRQLLAFTMAATPTARNRRSDTSPAHLVLAQASKSDSITVRPSPVDGSLGPYLSDLVSILTNLRDALNAVADSGSDTFTISLKSSPPGATISYMRIGEPYQDYSRPTNIDQATFEYSLWTFRFTLGHCVVVKHPNPYVEKSPNLNADMQNCRKK